MSNTYAIVESGGKQYRAEKGSMLVVDRLPDDEGAKVSLRPVMFRGDKDVVLAAGDLEKVKVEAVVAGHERGQKLRVIKYKAKKGYRRRAGHRSELTRLEVTDVRLLTRKPAAKAEAKPAAEKPAAEAKKPAAKAGTASKPAAKPKASTAKKPAAKASSAKKPAAKKPAARKASTTRKTSSSRTKKEGS
jgi:large subunit ribosomal protein L21